MKIKKKLTVTIPLHCCWPTIIDPLSDEFELETVIIINRIRNTFRLQLLHMFAVIYKNDLFVTEKH